MMMIILITIINNDNNNNNNTDIERFCNTLWSEQKDFNEKAKRIKNVQTDNANIQKQH